MDRSTRAFIVRSPKLILLSAVIVFCLSVLLHGSLLITLACIAFLVLCAAIMRVYSLVWLNSSEYDNDACTGILHSDPSQDRATDYEALRGW